jgi:hypothetical protein
MTLTVNTLGDNPQVPGIAAEAYIPDQLIAGTLKLVTKGVTVAGAAVLQRGTVMGQQTIGTAAATPGKPLGGANTGNGTCSAVTVGANAMTGNYIITMLTATTFSVQAPNGDRLMDGATGTAYTDQLGFTITAGGTAFVAGDGFTMAVAAGSGNWIISVKTATDGSQYPAGILADYTDPTGGNVLAGVYVMGEFNQNALTMDASWTAAALEPILRPMGIFLKTFVSAADPS